MAFKLDSEKVSTLPETLKAWSEDVFYLSESNDQSYRDSLCDLMEKSLKPLSQSECTQLMAAMGEHWD